jgi:VCBS repeat-containing protein
MSTLLTFDGMSEMPATGPSGVRTTRLFEEDGFRFTLLVPPYADHYGFADWSSVIGGGPHLHADQPAVITRPDGQLFGITSLQVIGFQGATAAEGTIKFFGNGPGMEQVDYIFVTDGAPGPQTVTLPESFSKGLSSLSWQQPIYAGITRFANVALDNLVMNGAANRSPNAMPDTRPAALGTPLVIDVLANDSDPDGDALGLISVVTPPGKGSAVIDNGKVIYDPGPAFTGLPAGATETVKLIYVVADGKGGSAEGVIELTVTGVNDAPVATADLGEAGEGGSLVLDVLANDADPDAGAVLTLVSASAPEGLGEAGVVDGKLRWTPAGFDRLPAWAEELVTLTYVIEDEHGSSSVGTVRITVKGTNDAPTPGADFAGTGENEPALIHVLANDTDPDSGDTLTLIGGSAPPGLGTVTVSGGRLLWTPAGLDRLAPGMTEVVTLAYTVADRTGATSTSAVQVTVTGSNDGPVAAADALTTTENQAVVFDVLANDHDPEGDGLTLVEVTAPQGRGVVSIVDGKLRFDPGASFDRLAVGASDTVEVSYRVRDSRGDESASTAWITVTGLNDAPRATADSVLVVEDETVAGLLLANDFDVDAGDLLTVSRVNSNGEWSAAGAPLQGRYGTLTVQADGSYRYTADADILDTLTSGAGLVDVFQYEVSDGQGGVHSAALTVQVMLADDARTSTGTNKDDVLNGDASGPNLDDTIFGRGGRDVINGRGGSDVLYGGRDDDVLDGGAGRDRLFGEDGNDRLQGGEGDDWIVGGFGNDTLAGGSGRDTFVFSRKDGWDTILDFQLGSDRIQLDGGLTADRVELRDFNGNGVADAVLYLGKDGVLILDVGQVSLQQLLG